MVWVLKTAFLVTVAVICSPAGATYSAQYFVWLCFACFLFGSLFLFLFGW